MMRTRYRQSTTAAPAIDRARPRPPGTTAATRLRVPATAPASYWTEPLEIETTGSRTPYRLPKIGNRATLELGSAELVKKHVGVMLEDPRSRQVVEYLRENRLVIEPQALVQLRRSHTMAAPSFANAQLAPLLPLKSSRSFRPRDQAPREQCNPATPTTSGRKKTLRFSEEQPTLTPDTKFIWRLSPHRNQCFDQQAAMLSGPYSREFTVHVLPGCLVKKNKAHGFDNYTAR